MRQSGQVSNPLTWVLLLLRSSILNCSVYVLNKALVEIHFITKRTYNLQSQPRFRLTRDHRREEGQRSQCSDRTTSWAVRSLFPGRGSKFFSSPNRPDKLWGPPSLLFNGHRISFPGVKPPGRVADHSPPLSTEANTCSPPVCLNVADNDNSLSLRAYRITWKTENTRLLGCYTLPYQQVRSYRGVTFQNNWIFISTAVRTSNHVIWRTVTVALRARLKITYTTIVLAYEFHHDNSIQMEINTNITHIAPL
jgi:hypothetical protein